MTKNQNALAKSYTTRQADSFDYVETKAWEWRACEISSMNQATGEIEFDVPGYTLVTPITDRLPADQLAQLLEQVAGSGWAKGLCELCGALIKFPYPIVHDRKKLIMNVGSECVTNYTRAGREYKEKKKAFKDKLIRSKFRVWAPIAVSDIWSMGKKDDNSNRLSYPYYRLKVDLEFAIDEIDGLSSRRIRKLFKRAQALDISAPND